MDDISEKLWEVQKYNADTILTKCNSQLLIIIESHYMSELSNEFSRFTKNEVWFNRTINYCITDNSKKTFFTLFSKQAKYKQNNLEILKRIQTLANARIAIIKSQYINDIHILESFLTFSNTRFKNAELFYHEDSYAKAVWNTKEFGKSVFRYLVFQKRAHPEILTTGYLDHLKGLLAIFGLSSDDQLKVHKLNQYFKNEPDPFSFNITKRYDSVSKELLMAPITMMSNEKNFERLISDLIKKYGD